MLKGLLGGGIKLPEFSTDTILLLVLVYFLVADDSENISDTLLIIGVRCFVYSGLAPFGSKNTAGSAMLSCRSVICV